MNISLTSAFTPYQPPNEELSAFHQQLQNEPEVHFEPQILQTLQRELNNLEHETRSNALYKALGTAMECQPALSDIQTAQSIVTRCHYNTQTVTCISDDELNTLYELCGVSDRQLTLLDHLLKRTAEEPRYQSLVPSVGSLIGSGLALRFFLNQGLFSINGIYSGHASTPQYLSMVGSPDQNTTLGRYLLTFATNAQFNPSACSPNELLTHNQRSASPLITELVSALISKQLAKLD